MGIVFVCLAPFCKIIIPEKKYILPLIAFSLSFGVGVNFFLYYSIYVSSILAPITIGAQLTIPFGIILSSIFLKESISYNGPLSFEDYFLREVPLMFDFWSSCN